MATTAGQKQKMKLPFPQVPLVGQFFHSIGDDGQVAWQGVIIGNPEPGWYLLQLFEWMHGEPNLRQIVRIEAMAGWLFYANLDAMKYSYEYGAAREGGPYRKKIGEG